MPDQKQKEPIALSKDLRDGHPFIVMDVESGRKFEVPDGDVYFESPDGGELIVLSGIGQNSSD